MTHTKQFSNNWSTEISLNWMPLDDECESIKMGDLQFQYVLLLFSHINGILPEESSQVVFVLVVMVVSFRLLSCS